MYPAGQGERATEERVAYKGLFIGINRFRDAQISDLGGAVRDAQTLAALFQDSVPLLTATELHDEHATADAITAALNEHLLSVTQEDTVILTFSGHGTRTHRLVAHDTRADDQSGTTIDMQVLSDLFRVSPARRILCLLDCCFSGGASAKVIDGPAARQVLTLEQFAGEGRVLIAASDPSSPAYEHPGGGHGFLTQAFIQSLLESEGPRDVFEIIADVQARVRAASAQDHLVQAPTVAGFSQGGFTLPGFVRGARYAVLNPLQDRSPVTAEFESLTEHGFPARVTQAWADRFGLGLNGLQLRAINEFGILDGQSLLVIAPTSSGKTFVGELAAVRGVLSGRKAVFLVPYRALANEKYEDFKALYGTVLGFRVSLCTGDHQDDVGAFMRGKYDIAFLTYEMFLQLVLGTEGALERIGTVVLDEAQFVADPHRGIVVELILTQLRNARERGVEPQLLALSAVIGNINAFDEWLGIRTLLTTERPVPLELGVLDRTGIYESVLPDGIQGQRQMLEPFQVVQRRKDPSSQDVIVPLVRQLLAEDPTEQVLIFRNTKGSATGAARYLAAELGLPPAEQALQALPLHDLSGTSLDLRAALQGGTAFHTANLTRDERVVIERAFRDPAGEVRVLTATTTVAAGVNTPARTVIVVEHEFVGGDKRPFTVAEMRNMMGRAGRLGFNESGRAILLADTSWERTRLMQEYVLAEPGGLQSSFQGADLGTWLLRLLAQVKRVPAAELPGLLVNTYGGFLLARQDPDWAAGVTGALTPLMEEMLRLDLLEEEDGLVRLTILGLACGASSLSFASSKRLIQLFLQGQMPGDTVLGLLTATQLTRELDSTYTPMLKKGVADTKWGQQIASMLGPEVGRALQRYADDAWAFHARSKRSLMLQDWMGGAPMTEIEARYKTNAFVQMDAGTIRSIADTTRFHLRSVHALASALLVIGDLDVKVFDQTLARLEYGLPEEALDLLGVPVRLDRGEMLALYTRGGTSVETLRPWSEAELKEVLGTMRGNEVHRAIQGLD
jgi:helicase